MKKWMLVCVGVLLLAGSTFASEFIYKDVRGTTHYQCERPGRTGKVRVTQVSDGLYRVMGVFYSGTVKTRDPEYAAQKGCGELGGVGVRPGPKKEDE